jgi:hypothetical protein
MRSTPRFLVVSSPPAVKRLPDLYTALLDAGAELIFTAEAEGFPSVLLDHPRTSAVDLPFKRSGQDGRAVETFRAAADLVRFLSPDLETARAPRLRACRRLVTLAGWNDSRLVARELAELRLPREVCARLGSTFRAVEQMLPPEPALEQAVAALDVDAVLIVTRCILGGTDADAVKVARRLGLPSVMLVWSWDNLSGKAVLKEDPDRLLVWNDVQAAEAVEQHGVPPERVAAVGAPGFDRFFAEVAREGQPARGEEEGTVLYLGSSPKIAPQEPQIVDRWLTALRASDDAVVRDALVVVRPHPALRAWAEWSPPDERVVLAEPHNKSERERLSVHLRDARAVVALNTSAELEAAIAGRPVLTFRAGAEARGQEGSAHFAYLLEENGGFVIDARTLDEHVVRLGQVLRGDYDRDRIARFVEQFVRPGGVEQPALPAVTSAILDVARRAGDGRPAIRDERFRPANNGGRPGVPERRPRVLVVSPPALLRKVPDVFEAFLEADAEMIFSGKHVEKLRLPDEILAHPRASAVALPLVRTGEAAEGATVLRALADAARFLGTDPENAPWPRIKAARRLLKLVHHQDFREIAPQAPRLQLPLDVQARLSSAFRHLERLLPPPPGLTAAIDALDLDAVLLVTRCTLGGFEPDVIKAARQLGLPSSMLVWSWDNLSSKAVLNEHPDRLLVWNDLQAAEAVRLHGISPDRITVVGAANFDRFFEEVRGARQPATATESATVLYLGSSPNVAPNEPQVFDRWLAAVRTSGDPALRDAAVKVRPHPGARTWRTWSPPDERVRLMIAPTKTDLHELAQLLAEAKAVVALNTSAEIEAAIADRPVLTFRAGPEAAGQEGSLHFKYLLEQEGGFVIDALTLEEHVQKLGAVLRGEHDLTPLREFVGRFVRPAGLEHPVAPQIASAVLELATVRTAVSV